MNKGYTTKQLLRRIYKEYLKKHLLKVSFAFLFMVIYALCEAVTIKLLEPVIDEIFVAKKAYLLVPLCVGMLFIFLIKSFCDFAQARNISSVGLSVVADFRDRLFCKITDMDINFFDKTNTGQLISRFSVDVDSISGVVSNAITRLGKDIFSIIFLVGLMFYQDVFLATAVFVILPIAIYPIDKLGRVLKKATKGNQEEMGRLNIRLKQVFQGIKEIKSYNMQEFEQKQTNEIIDNTLHQSYKAAKAKACSLPIMDFLGGMAITAVVLYGGHRVMSGQITTGTFFSFVGALVAAARPIQAVGNLHVSIQEGLAGAERLFSVLDSKRTMLISPPKRDFVSTSGDIRFSDVSFSYEGTDVGIKDFSLEVKRGKTIALVGASGAGKSTIMNLLLRFYDVDKGVIELSDDKGDYFDIRDISLYDLRCQLSLVSQDVVLFDDTIRNNISYGSFGASQEDILLASKKAYADEFIKDLELGYDTIVGERGAKLSGGQKQRISIARAMLKDAPILLLDEATSALDTQSEQKVQSAIEKLMSNKTTIVIAHRLSTVQNADEIIVLDKGKIIEKGNHKNLMNKKGNYFELYNMQFAKSERK